MTHSWTPTISARGFSLVEVTIASLIVGVLMTASMSVVAASVRSRAAVRNTSLAHALAEQLLAEISAQSYADEADSGLLGPETGEEGTNRLAFDDVDDYADSLEKPAVQRDGSPVAGDAVYYRSAEVVWIDPTTMQTSGSDTGIKRITVRVSRNDKLLVSLATLRTRSWEDTTP